MAIVAGDAEGSRRAARVLDSGVPVIMPLPSPLPYVVAGTNAANVNAAKGRARGQTTGMVVADLAQIAPYVELDASGWALARWLATDRMMNLLLPVRAGVPGWAEPSISDGWLGVTTAWAEEMRDPLAERGFLYVSSANRTGARAALTASAANAAFAGRLLVVDGDAFRDPAVPSGSATIVRVDRRGELSLVRRGIQDVAFADGAERFLDQLIRLWKRGLRS